MHACLGSEWDQCLDPGQNLVAHPSGHRVTAAVRVGGTGTGRRLLSRFVLPCQHALSERGPHHLADAQLLADRDDLRLDDAPQQAVLRLVGHQTVFNSCASCAAALISCGFHSETLM